MYDYFVTDHQQNVRMILSEEVQYASNTATMESSRSAQEEPVFGRSGTGNELAASRYATPSGWQNASVGAQVSRLGSLSGNMVGPNTLQKVMAGDQMSATVQYFFESAPGNSTPLTTMLLNTLGQLLSTGSQVGGLVKGNASAVTSQLGANPGFVNAVNPAQGGTNTPQAYLTMVFFDERFEPIAEADGGVVRQQVAQSVGSGGSTLGLGNIKAPRNSYVLVYVSNSSEQPVYFDNLQVGKVNGNILEENHYYSFGLRISGISSRRFTDQYQGETKNGYLYQGAFAELDDDIGWQDFALRSYDAQIGRFMQMDPFSQFASHYTGMGNDPVNMIDPSGGIAIDFGTIGQITGSALLDRTLISLGGAILGYGVDKLTGGNGWKGAAVGAGVSLSMTFIPPFRIGDVIKKVGDVDRVMSIAMVNSIRIIKPILEINSSGPIPSKANPNFTPQMVYEKPKPISVVDDPRFRYVKIAASFLGTSEVPGPGNNPAILEFHRIGSNDPEKVEEDSWCASFVNYCLKLGNPELGRTNNAGSRNFYLWADRLGLEEVETPTYGDLMLRCEDGRFKGGPGHVAIVVGKVENGFAQLGGNQALPNSPHGTTVNVVLRGRAFNVKYFHYKKLPKIPLEKSPFKTATQTVQGQKGTDR